MPGLHAEIIKIDGATASFRTSYGQNQLQHSVEAAISAGHDGRRARRGGRPWPAAPRSCTTSARSSTPEVEGRTTIIGADFIRRFGESPEAVEAVMGPSRP